MKTIDYVVSLGLGTPTREAFRPLHYRYLESPLGENEHGLQIAKATIVDNLPDFGFRSVIRIGDSLEFACRRREEPRSGIGFEWLDSGFRQWCYRETEILRPLAFGCDFLYGECSGDEIALLFSRHIQFGWTLSESIEDLYRRLMETQISDIRREAFSYAKCFTVGERAKR